MNEVQMSTLKKDGDLEVKRLEVSFEVKEVSEDDDFYYFEGYGSTFGNVDRGGDVVVQGAFKQSLMKQKPVMLWQHDRGEPIGVFAEIYEDDSINNSISLINSLFLQFLITDNILPSFFAFSGRK